MTATTASERILVSQLELARDLNLTDRRIRQLVTERILPPPREEGHDLHLSRRRYKLYSNGSDLDWERVFDEAEELARTASELNDKAYADDAVTADVTAASIAIQASTTAMAFLTAAKSKSQAERELFWGIWDREEHRALGALFARAMELEGQTHIRMDDGQLIEVIPSSPVARRRDAAKARKKPGRVKSLSRRRRA
jgi:hypothetical protein